MTVTEVTPTRGKAADGRGPFRLPQPPSRAVDRPRMRIFPFLLTLGTVALAGLLGWGMWEAYMGAPWTRDSTVRAYVVTMAPEVAGRIVELPVLDNKYVRKGDLLMVIDPTNYSIAVSQAEAAVQQAQADRWPDPRRLRDREHNANRTRATRKRRAHYSKITETGRQAIESRCAARPPS